MRVPELAPEGAIDSVPEWREHHDAVADLPVAGHDDLRWADGYAFGTPTRFGNVAAQLKQFIDTTSALWADGTFADKPVTGFTSAGNPHGGNEATLLALYNTMYHWGSIIVPTGNTDEAFGAAGGNPYGTAHPSETGMPGDVALQTARAQGQRLTRVTGVLAGLRAVAA